jgi:hypothetical protein
MLDVRCSTFNLFTVPVYPGWEEKDMNTISKNRVIKLNRIMAIMIAITIGFTVMPGFVPKVHSHKGAAFLGGMVAGHVVGGFVRRDKRRTRAMEHEAYDQPRTVQQATPAPAPAPAPAAKPTAQQRLDQLNKLAAGGYITPQEYKAKKKAILDSM